jgi:hypothetical protein
MDGGQNSHGRFCSLYLPAISLQFRESSEIDILRPTSESVEAYLLTSIRTPWYSTDAVRNLFGHMAGVSDRFRLPTFCNWPMAP